jgi:hypothetical protein
MAEPNKPIVIELSIELFAELILFLYPHGAEQMNLPHNFWLGLALWLIGTAIAVRMFWIFPVWASRLSRLEKALISFIAVSVFALAVYNPVLAAYEKRNGEPEANSLPTQSIDKPTGPDASVSGIKPLSKTAPSKPPHKQTNPVPNGPATLPVVPEINQSGNGNGAVGGNVTAEPCSVNQVGGQQNSATVNCDSVPPKIMNISQEYAAPDLNAKTPGIKLYFFVDGRFLDPAFAVYCDRPCVTHQAGLDGGWYNAPNLENQNARPNPRFVLIHFVMPGVIDSSRHAGLRSEPRLGVGS